MYYILIGMVLASLLWRSVDKITTLEGEIMQWINATYDERDGKLYDEDGNTFLAGNPSFATPEKADQYLVSHDIRATVTHETKRRR